MYESPTNHSEGDFNMEHRLCEGLLASNADCARRSTAAVLETRKQPNCQRSTRKFRPVSVAHCHYFHLSQCLARRQFGQ